ncbi:hypothetical protein [Candidatus Pelagibacter sp.]|uniref:hypothetical protein n=1 Tax=Candidatus Pelagibacter sp. TaxID=2024849 RepID=UPI003D107B19
MTKTNGKVKEDIEVTREFLQSLANSTDNAYEKFSKLSETSSNIVKEVEEKEKILQLEKQKKKDQQENNIRDTIKKFSNKFDMNSNKMIVERVVCEKVSKNATDDQVIKTRTNNIQKFYTSIFNNILVGVKSIYNVCVELYNAEQELKDDFGILKQVLPLSETTIAKYIKIGKSELLSDLYKLNKLPESWTTQYYITTQVTKQNLNSDETAREAFINMCSIYTTQKDVFEYFYGEKQKSPSPWEYGDLSKPVDFLKVAIESDNRLSGLEPNTLFYIRERVEEVVEDALKEMSVDKLGYSTDHMDKPMKVGVAFNEQLANGITTLTFDWITKLGSKELREKYLTAFKKKFKEITSKTVNSVIPNNIGYSDLKSK